MLLFDGDSSLQAARLRMRCRRSSFCQLRHILLAVVVEYYSSLLICLIATRYRFARGVAQLEGCFGVDGHQPESILRTRRAVALFDLHTLL